MCYNCFVFSVIIIYIILKVFSEYEVTLQAGVSQPNGPPPAPPNMPYYCKTAPIATPNQQSFVTAVMLELYYTEQLPRIEQRKKMQEAVAQSIFGSESCIDRYYLLHAFKLLYMYYILN